MDFGGPLLRLSLERIWTIAGIIASFPYGVFLGHGFIITQ